MIHWWRKEGARTARIVGHALARIVGRVVRVVASVDAIVVQDVEQLLESLVDEDERDQAGERLLRETRDVANLQKTHGVFTVQTAVSHSQSFEISHPMAAQVRSNGIRTACEKLLNCRSRPRLEGKGATYACRYAVALGQLTHQRAQVECHDDQQSERDPQPDPEAET